MDTLTTELDDLCQLLQTELAQARHPAKVICDSCSDLRRELKHAQEREKVLSSRLRELEKEMALSRKLREENESLRKQITSSQNQSSYQSLAGELSIERQRRVKAEQELAVYRKQGKTPEEKIAVNAKRVAVALAQHCLELTEEVRKLKGPLPSTGRSQNETIVISHEPALVVPIAAPASHMNTAWGLDDDIFNETN